jgi:hypothetical protein
MPYKQRMSPKKLAATLAAILRDFEPWKDPDRDHQWGGPQVQLSKEQVRVLPPYSIFLALVTFSNYPYYGHREKIAWTVPVRFKGIPYLISHQKFGLRIHPANPSETNRKLEEVMIGRLLHAVHITDALVKPFAEEQVRAGKVTIDNQGTLYRGKYEFFRAKAEECYERPEKMEGEAPLITINRKFKADREGFFYASAALEGYFSYLEHLLVLVLAFCDFDPAKDNLVEFITSFWTEKFQRIFDLGSDNAAEQVYHPLLQIKEKFRNPLSHGGFDRDATMLYFHVPGLGAVPMSLSRQAESIHFGFNPIEGVSFKQVCAVLDRADEFFTTGPKRLQTHCVMSGICISFSEQSVQRYRKAVESKETADAFVDYQLIEMDNATNMDW